MPRLVDPTTFPTFLLGGAPEPAALRDAVAALFGVPPERVYDDAEAVPVEADFDEGYAEVHRVPRGHFRCWFSIFSGPVGMIDMEPAIFALSERLGTPVGYDAEGGDPYDPYLHDLFYRGVRIDGVGIGEHYDEAADGWDEDCVYLWDPAWLRPVLDEATGWRLPEDEGSPRSGR